MREEEVKRKWKKYDSAKRSSYLFQNEHKHTHSLTYLHASTIEQTFKQANKYKLIYV